MADADDTGNRLCSAPVRPIHVPMAIGAMRRGVEHGPETLEQHLRSGLSERSREHLLSRLCKPVHVPVAPMEMPDGTRRPGSALYLEEVATASEHLAGEVSASIANGELALTLGGDHALSIGSIAGAACRCERLAVIWIDAHADLNWPEVSPSGRLHGMSLGASLGRGPARVVDLHWQGQKVRESDAYLVGVRLLDSGEEAWLRNGQSTLIAMPEIDDRGIRDVMEQVVSSIQSSGADAVHVSFDVDSLDPLVMPGTGTPVHGGFTYREASTMLRMLHRSSLPVRSIDWVELNPALDPSGASSEIAAWLLAVVLGDDVILRGAR